jgi:hypothetical protein
LIEWLDLDLNNIFNINDNLGMKNNSKIIQNELDIASMNKLTEKNIDSVIDILSSFKKNVGYKNS